MSQFIAYLVEDDGGTPVATGATYEEAQEKAITRVLSMAWITGGISTVQNDDFPADMFVTLTKALDKFFIEKGIAAIAVQGW